MMNLFKKKEQVSASSSGEQEYNPLSNISIVDGCVVYGVGAEINDNITTEADGRLHDAVMSSYGPEKFERHLRGALGWVGRKKSLQSLQIDPNNEDFERSSEVLYERLMSGPAASLLDRLSDKAVEDIIIISLGFAPIVVGTIKEISQKKKASGQVVNNMPVHNQDNMGEDHV